MKKIFLSLLVLCSGVFAQTNYNAIATAYVTTTISQDIVFNSAMQQGGTFTFSVLAHNGGGRAGQSDTANVKIQFYTSNGTLVSTVNSTYSNNLLQPTQSGTVNSQGTMLSGNPQADPAVPWSTLTISSTNCGGSCSNVAYAKVSMYGIDGSYWAGDYGPWYRAPTFQHNGSGNLLYNPEFGPYNGTNAQGWITSPAMGACQGAWGGSNPCIVNSDGTPGVSTVGLVANENGGGPSATGGTTSGTAGGYNNTMSVTNAGPGTGLTPAPTATGTSITYSTRNVTSGTTTQVYRTATTTTTWSDGTTTTSNGTESLYQTRVNSTIVTNKIVNGVLTTISTPITKVTTAATGAVTVESNRSATTTTQTVNQGLNAEVFRYDPKNYNCLFGICAWNFTYHTPSTNRNSYGNPVNTYRTTNGMFFSTNSNLPNNDNSLFGRNDGTVIRFTGTITAPVSQGHPAGSVYRLYFYNNTDDGFKMNINGGTVINQNDTIRYQTLFSYTSSGWMDVVAGQTYNLEAWYWNTTGGLGHTLYWDYGDGMRTIPNTAFTDGVIDNIVIDLTGVSYSDPVIVDVSGSSVAPTIVSTSTSDVISSSSTSTDTNSVGVSRPTTTGNYTDGFVGTTTVTTTDTTPVTTTIWSDGSTTSSNGSTTTTTDTTYTITTTQGTAPTYSRTAPNTNGNSVYIKQVYGNNPQVSVTQDGNNNAVTGTDSGWATVDGNGSAISIQQYGQGNITGVKMNAWGNNIDIKQKGSAGGDVSNNLLNLESMGNGNSATLQQQTNTNTASVKITYDINTVNLTQKGGTGNTSYVTINGNWNTVNNTQNGSDNFSLINISGDQNTATVNQTGTGHSTLLNLIGNKNSVSVTQTGAGDTYSLQQTCTNPSGCSVSVVRNK